MRRMSLESRGTWLSGVLKSSGNTVMSGLVLGGNGYAAGLAGGELRRPLTSRSVSESLSELTSLEWEAVAGGVGGKSSTDDGCLGMVVVDGFTASILTHIGTQAKYARLREETTRSSCGIRVRDAVKV